MNWVRSSVEQLNILFSALLAYSASVGQRMGEYVKVRGVLGKPIDEQYISWLELITTLSVLMFVTTVSLFVVCMYTYFLFMFSTGILLAIINLKFHLLVINSLLLGITLSTAGFLYILIAGIIQGK